ncbi:MAG: GAF domain-containing protein, partial [Acidobacteriaceae bacterium]
MAPHWDNPPPEHLRLLYRISRSLLREAEFGELLSGLLDTLIEELGADRGFVIIREGGELRATVARNYLSEDLSKAEAAFSRSISKSVMETGRTVLIGDASMAEPYNGVQSIHKLAVRSVLCAPLVTSDEAFALIYLENRKVPSCFSEEQRALLDEVCVLSAPRLRVAVAMNQAERRAEALERTHSHSDGILTSDPGMARVLQTVH